MNQDNQTMTTVLETQSMPCPTCWKSCWTSKQSLWSQPNSLLIALFLLSRQGVLEIFLTMELRDLNSCPAVPFLTHRIWANRSLQQGSFWSENNSVCKDVEKINEESLTQQLCAGICTFCSKYEQAQCIKKIRPDPWLLENYENNSFMFPLWPPRSKPCLFPLENLPITGPPFIQLEGWFLTLELLTPFSLERKGSSTIKWKSMCIPWLCWTLLSSTQRGNRSKLYSALICLCDQNEEKHGKTHRAWEE